MAYARFGHGSSVYIWPGGEVYDAQIFCDQCSLFDELNQTFEAHSPKEMIDHLLQHQERGHNVDDALMSISIEYSEKNANRFMDYVKQVKPFIGRIITNFETKIADKVSCAADIEAKLSAVVDGIIPNYHELMDQKLKMQTEIESLKEDLVRITKLL